MRRRIVGQCRTINNCAHGAAALCHSKLERNYFVQIHSGTKCKYKYTDVQSANTNTNCKMYSRAMARSQQCAIFYTVDNRCAKASNMGDGRTIQIQCCLCSRREIDQCTAVSHLRLVCTSCPPPEWCQQNWCYMYMKGTSTSSRVVSTKRVLHVHEGHKHKHNMYVRGTGADRNPPPSRKLPVVSTNASPLHLTVLLQHPVLAPLTHYFAFFHSIVLPALCLAQLG